MYLSTGSGESECSCGPSVRSLVACVVVVCHHKAAIAGDCECKEVVVLEASGLKSLVMCII